MSQTEATQAAVTTPQTPAAAPPQAAQVASPPAAATGQAAPASTSPAAQPNAPLTINGSVTWEQILASMRQSQQGAQQPAATTAPATTAATPAAPAQPAAAPAATQAAPATQQGAQQPAATTESPEVAALQAQLRGALIRSSVEGVAGQLGAINAADVLTLMGDTFAVDAAGTVMVRGQPGVSVRDAVAAFLNTRPHLMRPAVPAGGSGASAAPSQTPATPPPPNPMTNDGATQIAHAALASILNPAARPRLST